MRNPENKHKKVTAKTSVTTQEMRNKIDFINNYEVQ